jgi:protein TonB
LVIDWRLTIGEEPSADNGVQVVKGGRMAADLFGTVTQTPAQLGGRRWYTLPLSILTHATVVAAIVVVPLANSELPEIRRAMSFADIDITPVVPPPPPPMRRASPQRTERPAVSPDVAPTEAPTGIAPEPLVADLPEAGDEAGVPNGIPGGLPTESTLFTPPLPPPVDSARPIRITKGVTPPRRIVYAKPVYPAIALANRVSGRVVIEAIIGPTGDVESTRVVQSVKFLDEAALTAVRQWKYTPTLLSGVPVSVILTVSVDFTLQ